MNKILDEMEYEYPWQGLTPTETFNILKGFQGFWCIAGGWALDLFLNDTHRAHEDSDILIFKKDLPLFRRYFSDWDLYLCDPPGKLRSWQFDEDHLENISQGWIRRRPDEKWMLDVLLVDSTNHSFIYKRDENLHFILEKSIKFSTNGIPYLAPEVQLFHKAKSLREKDELDLKACLPFFDSNQKIWLRNMIKHYFGGNHSWLQMLK